MQSSAFDPRAGGVIRRSVWAGALVLLAAVACSRDEQRPAGAPGTARSPAAEAPLETVVAPGSPGDAAALDAAPGAGDAAAGVRERPAGGAGRARAGGSAGGIDEADDVPLPSAGCARPAAPALVEAHGSLAVAGETRAYILDAPPSAPDDPRPLILAFHGFGDSAAGFRRGLRLYDLAQRERVLVVHAHGHEGVELLDTVGRGWDLAPTSGRDRAFVEALLTDIERTRCVDRRRIFATGFSNGGFFANLLACTMSDRLAAVAAVGGAAALDECAPTRPVPILLMHGAHDPVVDPAMVQRARAWWAERNGCGAPLAEAGCLRFAGCAADVVYCEGPQAHRWPRDGVDVVWRFFRAHPRGGPAPVVDGRPLALLQKGAWSTRTHSSTS